LSAPLRSSSRRRPACLSETRSRASCLTARAPRAAGSSATSGRPLSHVTADGQSQAKAERAAAPQRGSRRRRRRPAPPQRSTGAGRRQTRAPGRRAGCAFQPRWRVRAPLRALQGPAPAPGPARGQGNAGALPQPCRPGPGAGQRGSAARGPPPRPRRQRSLRGQHALAPQRAGCPRRAARRLRSGYPQCVIEGRIQPVAAVIIGAPHAHGAATTGPEPPRRLTTLAATRPLPLQGRPATRDADPQCVIEGRTRPVAAVILGASKV